MSLTGRGELETQYKLQTFDDWLEVVENHVLLSNSATTLYRHCALFDFIHEFALQFFERLETRQQEKTM